MGQANAVGPTSIEGIFSRIAFALLELGEDVLGVDMSWVGGRVRGQMLYN